MAIDTPPDDRAIEVVVKIDNGSEPDLSETYAVLIRGKRNVVDFKQIEVRIDMLDRRTAKDLFGGQAANDYHISKIRILNDMNVNEGGGPASSILFFSDSLEVQVSLEKQAIKKPKKTAAKPDNDDNDDGWVSLSYDEIRHLNNWEACESQSTLERERTETQLRGMRACRLNLTAEQLKCDSDYPTGIERQKCRNVIEKEYLKCQEFVKRTVEDGPCGDRVDCQNRRRFCEECSDSKPDTEIEARNGQWIPFRPFVYQVVANTHDRRDERSVRSRIFMGASILGVGTSFVTSIAVPGAGSDLPLGLDKYQNLLVPAMERLFPSMREVQRQNILSEVLPPLVEVPYGSDVSKYVFFPKTSIYGILPGYRVRITSISSYRMTSKVGMVQKATVNQ